MQAAVPVDTGASFEQALHGGEDYELLFAAPAKARIPNEIAGVAVSRIGRLLPRHSGRAPITLVNNGREQALRTAGLATFLLKSTPLSPSLLLASWQVSMPL